MTDAAPRVETELSADQVRRLQLRAQGLLGAGARRGGVPGMLRRLGAVQLDTISVLARSHELIAYARLGAVGRDAVEAGYWGGHRTFEYWAHAASILPMEDWPHFAFRRRAFLRRGWRWHKVSPSVCDDVRALLRSSGPLTTRDLGGAKAGGDWWQWSDHKIAIEWLLDTGEVVCTERTGWRRRYDLAERAVPGRLLAQDPDDTACLTHLVREAGRALAVGTRADLADHYRLRGDQVDAVIGETGLVPVAVRGWKHPAWADPEALASEPRGRHATTLLSPFDSLVWDRARTSRVFGFDHRLEAYVPKAKRVHGYFVMPLLAGGRLIGRVDPAREGRTLVAKQVSFEPHAATPARAERSMAALREALETAAGWVGCDDVRIERIVAPGDL
ncbi:winged helix-turn-helix domain-containing protein [Actinomadura flavalba]|uniref:winged helix-turn-helix domain-containing protein n=1 Tax=Actinomadura flavalba TaxID=1120938 RepID=UPI000527F265|nr:crosslink repair DNA glycosylase YcaQ family protein [Actinomadura flavalba]